MSLYRVFAICAAVALVVSPQASAQVLYGSIVGNVTDESQSAVPQAAVKIVHLESNQSREFITSDDGGYNFVSVPAGTYTVTVTRDGFRTYVARGITVEANTLVRVNASLQVGAVSQSVDVTATASALQTDRADVRSEITNETLQNMPVTGRSYQSLLFLTPGATQPHYFQTGGINNPSRAMSVSINGTPASSTVIRIDGVTATNQWIEDLQAYSPGIEAIETVNTVTSSFEAEQGMTGGASVNVQIKSGSNSIHGSAFEYVQNSALRARGFFLPADTKKTQSNKNIFGGTLGGPIKKDKLFYFGSWESTITREAGGPYALSGLGSYLTLPDAAVRSGNLSASTTPIYDPATGTSDGRGRTPFPGNIIPANRLNPTVTGKILPLLPLPTRPGSSNNYFSVPYVRSNYHKMDAKVNWNATSRLSANARFSYLPATDDIKGVFEESNALSLSRIITANVSSSTGAATYVLSPTFVIDGLFGFTRQHTQEQPGGPDQCWGDEFNLPNSCTPGQRLRGTPIFRINNWTTLGGGQTYDYLDPQFQYTANAGWTKKSHNIRFGMDVLRLHMNHYEVPTANFPGFTFTGGVTALNGGPAPNQYNSFGDFLVGLTQSVSNGIMNPPLNDSADPARPATLRTTVVGLYVRDQWQVTRKFTASLGLRWEYYPVPARADRGIELFDFDTNRQLICGVGSNAKDCGIEVSPKLFSPRLGLAFRPTDTFVIRSGFSLNWQQNNMYRNGLTAYPSQIAITKSGLNTYNPAQTIEEGFPAITPVDVSSGSISLPPGSGTTTLPKEFVRGYVMSWNFTVEKALAHNLTAQAGYVGTRMIRGIRSQNVNYGTPGGGSASQPYFRSLGIQAGINVVLPMLHTYYDALQASVNRRFANGISFNAGYTWSKYITNFAGSISDPQYFHRNKGVAQEDVPHKLTVAATAELPFGKGKAFLNEGGLASALSGGWQLNGLFAAFSGSPFTITANATALNAPGNPQLADQVNPEVKILGGVGFNTPYFDPLAFASVNQPRYGSAGFNSLRGPGIANLDLSVFRDFRVTERLHLQFRAEAFNLTNTPHFWSPGSRPNNFQLSFVNDVSNMVLNQDGTIRSLNNYATITNVNSTGRDFDERYFRLGLRMSF